jgi:hypothetical protein
VCSRDAIARDAAQAAVDRVDVAARVGQLLLGGAVAEHVGEERVVDLQREAGVDDRRVLLVHRVGDGGQVLGLGGIVLVAAHAAGRHRADEHLVRTRGLAGRRAQQVQILSEPLVPCVGDRAWSARRR